jgi:threonine/homoserine/homoserine lactone efflux protein
MSALLVAVAVAAIVVVVPGQDTALVIKNTLAGRREAGVATALGVSTGVLTWALATSIGLAAVLVASERVFLAIKLLGAAYLVFLGLHALAGALRRRGHGREPAPVAALGPRAAYRQGALSNLGNPKMAVFFTSLLPQFAGPEAGFLDLFALGVVFVALTLAWLAVYAVAVDRVSAVFRRPLVRRAIDAVTGAVLVALGLRLATERR